MKTKLSNEMKVLKKIASTIQTRGGSVFFVGGYIRDKYTGKENKDIDVEVYGLSPDVLKEVLREYGAVDEVGASFGVYMVHGLSIDFSLPRKELRGKIDVVKKELIFPKLPNTENMEELLKLYQDFRIVIEENERFGHKDFIVVPDGQMDKREASKRRDFTMNALMEDVLTGDVYDYWNGRQDISDGVVRHINEKTFIEDPLRVLRACQFASRFNFQIAEETKKLCRAIDLTTLPKERLFTEIEKALMKSEKPSIAMNYWRELGVTKQLFPELHDLITCEQNPLYHAEGTVWNHTMLVIDVASEIKELASNPLNFMFGSLCHDMGKPMATKTIDGRITSRGHDFVGIQVAESFMQRLTTDKKLIEYVKDLTKHHMRLLSLYPNGSDKALRKLALDTNIKDMRLFAEADYRGRGTVQRDFTPIAEWFESRSHEAGATGKITQLVTGKDLIELGFIPGKEFGELLKTAMSFQLEGLTKQEILQKIVSRTL